MPIAQNDTQQHWLITGANGNLGRRLVKELLTTSADHVRAVVRSARAAEQLANLGLTPQQSARLEVVTLNYTDEAALAEAADGCSRAVHLVGILKETKTAAYRDAHELSCMTLAKVCDQSTVTHITYLSILGSTAQSSNACLASKGAAEDILLAAATPTCVLRVPMVLGEGDYASAALLGRARQPRSFAFRPESLEQPVYAGDVTAAIRQAVALSHDGALDLAGPESLSRRALLQRTAACMGSTTQVLGLPLSIGFAFAWVVQTLLANPPLTTAMLGVLDHDDDIDPAPALHALQLSGLTAIEETVGYLLTN